MVFFVFIAFYLMPILAFVLMYTLTGIWIQLHNFEDTLTGLRILASAVFALIVWTLSVILLMGIG